MIARFSYLAWIGLVLLVMPTISWSASQPFKKLGDIICKQGLHVSPRDLTTRYGIYEAQVSGHIYKKVNDKAFNNAFVMKQAADSATAAGHLSSGWGRCPNGDAWSVSAPAPDLKIVVNKKTLTYSAVAATKVCSQVEVLFAPAAKSEIVKIEPKLSANKKIATISMNTLSEGLISITCKASSANPKAGNVLWYLIPNGQITEVPDTGMPGVEGTKEGLIKWVQKLRSQYKLSALKLMPPQAGDAAMRLSHTQSISHDLEKLKREAEELAKQKVELIGEDRVIGSSLEDMQWLLWYSASHRSLILNTSADQFAAYVERLNGSEELAVLIFAKTLQKM